MSFSNVNHNSTNDTSVHLRSKSHERTVESKSRFAHRLFNDMRLPSGSNEESLLTSDIP